MDAAGAVRHIADGVEHLGGVDLDTLCNAELDEFLTDVVRLQQRLDAVAAHLAARWDAHVVWATKARSAAAALANQTGCARRTAKRIITRGRALRDMPATDAAYCAGELSSDHVDLLATCTARDRAELFRDHEQTLVDEIVKLDRYDQAAKAVAYWKKRADAAVGDDGDEPDDTCGATITAGVNGERHLDADLDPLGGAEFEKVLEGITDELEAADKAIGATRTRKQLRAAALVEMARRAAAMPPDARKPRPLITIVCGQNEFTNLCELSNGVVIGPDDLTGHLDDIDIETIIVGGSFTAISKSSQRSFTGALRRAIQVRDRHCQHPDGCDEPIDRCDVDHIIPRCRGGPTTQHNGRLLCRYHNRIDPQHTKPPP